MSSTTTTPTWRRTVVLALIMGAQLMMVLDTSIVTTALPHLVAELCSCVVVDIGLRILAFGLLFPGLNSRIVLFIVDFLTIDLAHGGRAEETSAASA